jgi:hypothetical protein
MDIAKSIFSHRDREGYVGKEDHNVSEIYPVALPDSMCCRNEKWNWQYLKMMWMMITLLKIFLKDLT